MDTQEILAQAQASGEDKRVWKKTGVLRYATVDPRPLGWVTDKLHTAPGEKTGSQISGYTHSCTISGDSGEEWVPAADKLRLYSMPDGSECTPEALQEEMARTGKPWVLISQASENPKVNLGIMIPEDFMFRAPWEGAYQMAHAGDMLIVELDEDGNPAMTEDVDKNLVLDARVIAAEEVNKIYEGPGTEGYPEADLPDTIPYPTGITVGIEYGPDGEEIVKEIPNEVLAILPPKNLEQMRLAEEALAEAEAEGSSEMLDRTKACLQKISDGNDRFLSSTELSPAEFDKEYNIWYWDTFHEVDDMVRDYDRTYATLALIKYDAETANMCIVAYEHDLFPVQRKTHSAVEDIKEACEAVRQNEASTEAENTKDV